jgi:DNA-binding transcriptional MerR regulator
MNTKGYALPLAAHGPPSYTGPKSIRRRAVASHHPIRKTVAAPPPAIPDKLYFRIGDVARLCEVPAYVLRFWETEFPQLKPNKGGTGQRLYRRKDVEMALRIKGLLYDQGYTIAGARQILKQEALPPNANAVDPMAEVRALGVISSPRPATPPDPLALQAHIHELQAELLVLRQMLAAPAGTVFESPRPTKIKTMRPRLEALPQPTVPPAEKPGPRLHLNQRDLFDADPVD